MKPLRRFSLRARSGFATACFAARETFRGGSYWSAASRHAKTLAGLGASPGHVAWVAADASRLHAGGARYAVAMAATHRARSVRRASPSDRQVFDARSSSSAASSIGVSVVSFFWLCLKAVVLSWLGRCGVLRRRARRRGGCAPGRGSASSQRPNNARGTERAKKRRELSFRSRDLCIREASRSTSPPPRRAFTGHRAAAAQRAQAAIGLCARESPRLEEFAAAKCVHLVGFCASDSRGSRACTREGLALIG